MRFVVAASWGDVVGYAIINATSEPSPVLLGK